MIRTLVVLEPNTRADGGKCLRGTLTRSLTTTDHHGGQRTYPQGTPIMLVKNQASGSYSLLATLPDDDLAAEIAAVTDRDRETEIPF